MTLRLAEGQTSYMTILAIAGHVSRKMLEHYSRIRMEAKRTALDGIATTTLNPVIQVSAPLRQRPFTLWPRPTPSIEW